MGSIDKACISGFLCRLCSEMHRLVFHIYGDQGKKLCLVEKINGYLPITISPTDPLPKTICETCLKRVEQHYELLMRLSRIKEERFLRVKKIQRTALNTEFVSSPETSDDDPYNSDDDYRSRRRESILSSSTVSVVAASTSSHTPLIIEESSSPPMQVAPSSGNVSGGAELND